MPANSYEVTARSAAPPEKVFALLADAPGWKQWAGFVLHTAEWEREGTPAPGGIGAIRKMGRWPQYGHEEIVAYEPPHHHAYTMLRGNPVKNYRADVYLKEDNGGTIITWGASFDPKIPGTGKLVELTYKRLIGGFAKKLAKYAETH
jgi:uncharacterized protein YndB with AHSA1/START domain